MEETVRAASSAGGAGMSGHKGWIGVDLDGTLAVYNGWVAPTHIGEPVVPMLERVKAWLAEGREVRIMTARVYPIVQPVKDAADLQSMNQDAIWRGLMQDLAEEADQYVHHAPDHEARVRGALDAAEAIQAWCLKHLGQVLAITCVKDYSMVELWDDRAVQVRPNTGLKVGEVHPALRSGPPTSKAVGELLEHPETLRAFLGLILELHHDDVLPIMLDRFLDSEVSQGKSFLRLDFESEHGRYTLRNVDIEGVPK